MERSVILTSLVSLFGGGLTGLIGAGINKYFDYKSKKLDIQLEQSKFEHQQVLAQMQYTAVVEVEDSKAFKEAQTNEPKKYYEGTEYTPTQRWFALGLDFVRGLVRPVLTIYLCVLTTFIYIKAARLLNGDVILPGMALDLTTQIIQTILYLTTTAVCFWFGSRGNKAPKIK